MTIAKKTEKQLRELLEQFFIAYSPGVNESREILAYLFGGQILPPFYADGDLYETLLYLRDVADSQGIDNIQSLQQYIDSKKLKITRFLTGLIGDMAGDVRHSVPDRPSLKLEAEKLPILDNYHEKICDLLETSKGAAMSKSTFSKVAVMLHRLLTGSPTTVIQYAQDDLHSLHGVAKTYLQAFGIGLSDSGLPHIKRGGYFSHSSENAESEKAYIFDLSAFQSGPGSGRPLKMGNMDQKYAKIMSQVKQERPIWGRRFKLLLMEWLFCKMDSKSNSSHAYHIAMNAVQLFSRRWSILKCPSKESWLNSGNVGVKINMDAVRSGDGPFWSSDLLSHTQERDVLYYPLSRDYCLRIDSATDEIKSGCLSDDPVSFVCCSNKELKLVNRISAAAANESIVAYHK